MLISNGDFFRLRWFCQTGTQISVNSRLYWVEFAGEPVNETPADFFDELAESIAEPLRAAMSDQSTYVGYGVARVSPNPTREFRVADAQAAGTIVSDPMPSQVAAVVTVFPEEGPPRLAGRNFFGPLAASLYDGANQKWTDPGIAKISAIADAMIDHYLFTIGTVDVTYRPILTRETHSVVFVVTNHIVRGRAGTQRRRSHINRSDVGPIAIA